MSDDDDNNNNNNNNNVIDLKEFNKRKKEAQAVSDNIPPRLCPAKQHMLSYINLMLNDYGTLSVQMIAELIEMAGFRLSYNEVLMRQENFGSPMNEAVTAEILSEIRQLGELFGDKQVFRTLTNRNVVSDAITYAHMQAVHNPIKSYLKDLRYVARADRPDPFSIICDSFSDDDDVLPLFMRKFLLGCVHRAFTGYQNFTLVLQGAQGLGKSTFCRWLCKTLGEDYFQEGVILPGDKDHRLRLAKKFIWAVDEFGETFSRSSQNALKAFLSQDTISERPAYGRFEVHAKRQCNVIATTNDDKILCDKTGNRRYLIVKLSTIDHEYSKLISPDDLWAQVMWAYKMGERPYLTPDEQTRQRISNTHSEEEDALEDYLDEILVKDAKGFTAVADVYVKVFTRFAAHGDRIQENQLRRATRSILLNKWKCRPGRTTRAKGMVGITLV